MFDRFCKGLVSGAVFATSVGVVFYGIDYITTKKEREETARLRAKFDQLKAKGV